MASFLTPNYSKKLLPLISWGHWFTFFNIVIAVLLSSFYLFSEAMPETGLGQVYLITNWISHISFLIFMCFVLILFPLILIYPSTRFIRTSASLIYTFILLLMLLDGYVYSQLGYHLNASSNDQIITLISSLINENNRLFWSISIMLMLVFLSFQFIASNYAWKHLRQLQRTTFARKIIIGLIAAFSFSHIIHIWADAKLEYDILRQDSYLPLSYPTTAKTLLTKYGMFNHDDYIERKTAPLALSTKIPSYPELAQTCSANSIDKSVFLIVTKNMLSADQINQTAQRSSANSISLLNHIDNASVENAWFNLFYALPTIYKQELITQNATPMLVQAIKRNKLMTSLTIIGENPPAFEAEWFDRLFDKKQSLTDISSLIYAAKLNSKRPGLHVISFTDNDAYQFELFIDALLLAQKKKQLSDIIWISSIGNNDFDTRFQSKPAILIAPDKDSKKLDLLTSQMDVSPTLMKLWLNCTLTNGAFNNGENITELSAERIFANTMNSGIMVFNKDKSIFIDQNGNFQSYSQQLDAPIIIDEDFPLMIDGVHFIKKFAIQDDMDEK